jgi:hypothetical protein
MINILIPSITLFLIASLICGYDLIKSNLISKLSDSERRNKEFNFTLETIREEYRAFTKDVKEARKPDMADYSIKTIEELIERNGHYAEIISNSGDRITIYKKKPEKKIKVDPYEV